MKNIIKRQPGLVKFLKGCISFPKNTVGLTTSYVLKIFDFFVPKSKNIWIFPVHFYIGTFSDNVRAVFEEVKNDRAITKVILTKNVEIEIATNKEDNIVVLPMKSLKGYWFLLRSKVIFVQHSLWHDFSLYHLHWKYILFRIKGRQIFNLWHGIPIKSIIADSTGINNRAMNLEKKHYKVVASSFNDRLVMSTAMYPVDPKNVIITGIPRNDFILRKENALPAYCQKQIQDLRQLIGNKKLIVYAPTYRELNLGGVNYEFNEAEVKALKEFLINNNAVMGFRLHYYNRSLSYEQLFDNELFFDLDQKFFPDMAMLIRESALIISDYSGLVVDTLYADKPILSFAYDYDNYGSVQRGFTYPLEAISPFPICKSFEELFNNVEKVLHEKHEVEMDNYKIIKRFFFEYSDDCNGRRVVDAVKANQSNY